MSYRDYERKRRISPQFKKYAGLALLAVAALSAAIFALRMY